MKQLLPERGRSFITAETVAAAGPSRATPPPQACWSAEASSLSETNYTSGDDYVVEFLGSPLQLQRPRLRAACDRSRGQARPSSKVNELDEEEASDLVALAAEGMIGGPQSRLGRYLAAQLGARVALVEGESLGRNWLRKLIFRGAWLDHQVKRGVLEVAWDDHRGRVRRALPAPRAAAGRCSSSRPCRRGMSSNIALDD